MTRLAIYSPSGQFERAVNPFGKDTANLDLFRALACHGAFEDVTFLTHRNASADAIKERLCGSLGAPARIRTANPLRSSSLAGVDAVLRGTPDLADLAWLRARRDDRAYSLIGLIHTLAPPAVREKIAQAVIAPIQPWDAVVCTSPAVVAATTALYDRYNHYLSDRFGGATRPQPMMPLIPLGVSASHYEQMASRPGVRSATRRSLQINDDDPVVFWLGRLSFFEKAFPQAMFRALEAAQKQTGANIHFVMAGWFPRGATDRDLYEQAARVCAPSIRVHFIDGNNREAVDAQWSAADIFLSLVDNIQETFGLTPLEAMAAGLPIVASDWDGYKFTVRDGIDGFLSPTLGGPTGIADLIGTRHVLGLDSYQTYVGTIAQYTAVDIAHVAKSLATLIRDKELRKRMGHAGQQRIKSTFDWSHIAYLYRDLVVELAALRAHAERFGTSSQQAVSLNPVKGDPFADFAHFATSTFRRSTRLTTRIDKDSIRAELERSRSLGLDMFAAAWRSGLDDCEAVLGRLCHGPLTVDELLSEASGEEAIRARSMSLMWMCKTGLLQWDD